MDTSSDFIRRMIGGDGEGLFSLLRSLARGDGREGALQTTVFSDSAKLFTLVHMAAGGSVERLPIPTGSMGFTLHDDANAVLYAVDHDPADPAATGVPTPGWQLAAGTESDPHLLPERAAFLHVLATAADTLTARFFGRRSTTGRLTFKVWARNAGGVTSEIDGRPVAAEYVPLGGIGEGGTRDLAVTGISAGSVDAIAVVGLAAVTEPSPDVVRIAAVDSDIHLELSYA